MKASYLVGLDESNSYESAPDVAAGSGALGFVASVTFMYGFTGVSTLAANYDDANDLGWRLMAVEGGNGSVQLSAEVGVDDGVTPGTVVQSGWFTGLPGQTVDLTFRLEDGAANNFMQLYANGCLLFGGSIGAGFAYTPAVGRPFQIGGAQSTPGGTLASGPAPFILGAGFAGDGSNFTLSDAFALYLQRQQMRGYSPMISSFGQTPGGKIFFTNAWDTQSLLQGGPRVAGTNGVASDTWSPAPDSGNQELTRSGSVSPGFFTLDPQWWHVTPGTAPGG